MSSQIITSQTKAIKAITNFSQSFVFESDKVKIIIDPKVCPPYKDSLMLAKSISEIKANSLLDLYSGSGIVAFYNMHNFNKVCAGDISPYAVSSIKKNIEILKVKRKFSVFTMDSLPYWDEKFDIITLNPPYTNHKTNNIIEMTAWDYKNKSLKTCLKGIKNYLNPQGSIYLSWANFASFELIESLILENNFSYEIILIEYEKLENFMQNKTVILGQNIEYRIYKIMLK